MIIRNLRLNVQLLNNKTMNEPGFVYVSRYNTRGLHNSTLCTLWNILLGAFILLIKQLNVHLEI